MALAKVQKLRDNGERIRAKERRVFNAQLAAYAQLLRLKKVRKKVRSKELYLVEQGLSKLEAKEAKMDSSPKEAEIVYTLAVDPLDNPAYLLPLTNPFIFSFFLMLPNPFSFNTPIPFL